MGLRPLDSGKTTLAYSLVKALRREGVNVVPVKPVGSAEAWLHPEALRWSSEHGVVVTPDAVKLSAALGGEAPLDALEPVAALHAPPDPARWEWSPQPYQAATADPNRTAALIRITSCAGPGRASVHAINRQSLQRAPARIAGPLSALASRLRPPPLPVSDEDVDRLLGPQAMVAADSCLEVAASESEVVVVESYSDVAAPTPGSLSADLVVAVAPGVAAIVEGSRYRKAVSLKGGSASPSLVSAPEAVQLAGVVGRVDLPLLEEPEEGYSAGDINRLIEAVHSLLNP